MENAIMFQNQFSALSWAEMIIDADIFLFSNDYEGPWARGFY